MYDHRMNPTTNFIEASSYFRSEAISPAVTPIPLCSTGQYRLLEMEGEEFVLNPQAGIEVPL